MPVPNLSHGTSLAEKPSVLSREQRSRLRQVIMKTSIQQKQVPRN